MTPETLVSEVNSILAADVTLAAEVKQFLIGSRDLESLTYLPALWIDVVADDESEVVYKKLENKLVVNIVGIIENQNPEKHIVGDASNLGILKLLNDVKLALDAKPDLNGKAVHVRIAQTDFTGEYFPRRIFSMQIEITYVQTKGTRS